MWKPLQPAAPVEQKPQSQQQSQPQEKPKFQNFEIKVDKPVIIMDLLK